MYHPHPHPLSQQSSSPTLSLYFPPQPHIVNTNPSPFIPYPQPIFPSSHVSEPPLHPPGTDPYVKSELSTSNYVGLEGQTQYYLDPPAGSQNWLITQGFNPLQENQVLSQSSNYLWNGHLPTQPLEVNATRIKQEQIKSTQPVRCEVCKIDCNSKDVFDKHVVGKKHRKNLEIQNSLLKVHTSSHSDINMLSQLQNISGQALLGTSYVTGGANLEAKKRKILESGAVIDSVRFCTICNIACNSQEVFNKHLSGKKHAAQAGLISQNPYVAAIRSNYDSSLKKKTKKNKVVQSAWCEVCKLNCNSTDIYAQHLTGKKHLKNMEKHEKEKSVAIASASNALPSATHPAIGPVENPAADKAKTNNGKQKKPHKNSTQTPADLESKKRKILESGTAANALKTCSVCNVVCNSETVFHSHLAGHKHAAMVKKQAESGMQMPGLPLVSALPT